MEAYLALQQRVQELERENEELRRIASEKHDEVLALEAAAITPEMREKMERAIAMYEVASCIEEYEEWAHGYAIDAFRDLLGEQG